MLINHRHLVWYIFPTNCVFAPGVHKEGKIKYDYSHFLYKLSNTGIILVRDYLSFIIIFLLIIKKKYFLHLGKLFRHLYVRKPANC